MQFSEFPPESLPEVAPQLPLELFVNPLTGIDRAIGDDRQRGTLSQPLKTLSHALQQSVPGSVIHLQPGLYDVAQGERFPLYIPPGVVVVGDVPTRGREIAIVGGGNWESPTFGTQNIALVMAEGSQVRGVTVTNPHPKGTGIWIEAATTTIDHCQLSYCEREGVFVTGEATPLVLNCWFLQNRASGITLTRYAKGEIHRCLFRQNRFGLTLSDFASPFICQSEMTENQVGLVLSGASRPVLRDNRIAANQEGMVTFSQAVPDLGDRQSPGGNYFQSNRDVALRNVGLCSLSATGNWLHPQFVRGAIEFRALQPVQTGGWEAEIGEEQIQPLAEPSFLESNQSDRSDRSDSSIPPDLVHHWSLPFVSELLGRGIIGCFADGTFQPNRPILRAQFAALVVRAFQPPNDAEGETASPPFSDFGSPADFGFRDVPADYWAAASIAQAAQMGFIEGGQDALFYPEQPLARWQAIVWLVKGLGLSGGSPNSLRAFRDRAEIPSIALSAVVAAHRLLVLPQKNRLAPLLPVTRAEIAAWIYQALRDRAETRESSDAGRQGQMEAGQAIVAIDLNFDLNLVQQSDPDAQVEPDYSDQSAMQAGFRVAVQVAERLTQKGVAAKLIQSGDHPLGLEERLTVLQQIQPTLLFQMGLVAIDPVAVSSPIWEAIGIQTRYAPLEIQPAVAKLHKTLLALLDLPDRSVVPLPEPSLPFAGLMLQVELALLAETLNHPDGIDPSFCTYLAEAIQQGLLEFLQA